MAGSHCVRTWSATQKSVALSSAEAELVALVRAASEAIGLCQLADSWNTKFKAELYCDSSAALAITDRRGVGRVRHLKVGHLWIQEVAADGVVKFKKIAGTENPADMFTKHLPRESVQRLARMMSQESRSGDAECRLRLDAVSDPEAKPRGGGGVSGILGLLQHACSSQIQYEGIHGHRGSRPIPETCRLQCAFACA